MIKVFGNFFAHLVKEVRSKDSFTQNFAITFSGNFLAQLIGFLFTPFVARIYGPEAYGVFALFMSIITNLIPVSTLQLPSGYVSASTEEEFFRLVKITLLILFVFTGACTLTILFWGNPLLAYFNAEDLTPYLFWIPVYLMLMGVDNILHGWSIRIKQFKRGVFAKVLSTIVTRSTTVALGIMYPPSAMGLIVSNSLTYFFEGAAKLSHSIRTSLLKMGSSTWSDLWKTFLKFKDYALFLTPGVFITNTSNLLPIFYFSYAFDKAAVGHFALSNSIVSLPLALVINSSITVFLQKAAETLQTKKEDIGNVTLSLYKKLFLLFFPILVIVAFSCRYIFVIVFGPEWEQAGVFASLLCVAAAFHVVHSPLSVLFRLTNNEHINLIVNILFLGIKFLGLWIGVVHGNIKLAIVGFCAASVLSSFVSLFVLFWILKISKGNLIRDLILVLLFGVAVVWFYY